MNVQPGTSRRWIVLTVAAGFVIAIGVLGRPVIRRLRQTTAPAHATLRSAQVSGPTVSATTPPRADVPLDLRRRQLIGVRTVAVTRASAPATIRTLGVVRAAETRLTDVNVKVEGWIRELHVDYTGQPVAKGQTLFSLYSPDLLATEREYVLAVQSRDELRRSMVPEAAPRSESLVAAARQKLQLWDLSADQIATLEQTLTPEATVSFRSPVAGFVLEKNAVTGMHVTPGQTLYRLGDLNVVWIEADAYEHDLSAIRIGATGHVTIDAYPGERLTARVAFISPSLQSETRTAKVRFEVENANGRLRPGMYANVDVATPTTSALVVPTDALLDSGREQIVFVARGEGMFEPRTVQVGSRRTDQIEITSGLKEGEEVATSAAFFLDSESQLRAGVSGYDGNGMPSPATVPSGAAQLAITLRSQPDPPKIGENTFEVSLKDASGQPVQDAHVTIQFFMPAMPTMNMPAMRNSLTLPAVGGGVYRGTGEVMMAGRWDATVTAAKNGQRIGALQTTVVAK